LAHTADLDLWCLFMWQKGYHLYT